MDKADKLKLSESDVCDLFITPAIKQAGWDQFTQVRRYKKHGAGDWTEVIGTEAVASPAAALTDGQTVP